MKKLLPVVISGVMAISFSQLAAAQKADVQGPAGTGANVDLNSKGSADVQTSQELGQSRQQPGSHDTQSGKKQQHDTSAGTSANTSATTGASVDSSTRSGSEDTNASPGASKSKKMEGDEKDKDKNKSKDSYGSSTSGSYK
jgi:hypothetical protein